MERLSVDYGKKSKLEFAIYPAPQVVVHLNKLKYISARVYIYLDISKNKNNNLFCVSI